MIKLNTIMFLIALSVLAVVHLISMELFLYWRYIWLDIPIHFVGGSVVALGAFAFAELKLPFSSLISGSLFRVMGFVVVVMLGWELFEIWAGVPMEEYYALDTAIDSVMGYLGGWLGYFVANRVKSL